MFSVHEVSGFAFETAEPFPGLPQSGQRPVARLSVSPHAAVWPRTEWNHRAVLPDGRAWPAFGKCPEGRVLDFEGVCTFLIARDGSFIEAVPRPGADIAAVQRLFLDQVIPLLLHLSGRECLHAGAVLIDGGACAFLGPSGAGKSTLAAKLALAGHALLSDDCLALLERTPDGIFALPGNRGSKLSPDSAEALVQEGGSLPAIAGHPAKRLLASLLPPQAPAPLRRIYILTPVAPGQPIEILPAKPQEIVPALLESSFRIDPGDAALVERQFRFLMRVAACVPVRSLRFAHDFATLPAVCQRLLEEAAL